MEVGNTVDKRFENSFIKSVKEMETEKELSDEVIDGEAVEPANRNVATTPSSPTDEEVARHNEAHLPCHAWCKVQVDYCHMTCDDIVGKPKLTILVTR